MKVMECDTKRRRLLVFLFTAGTERLKTSPVGRAEMTDLGFFLAATAWGFYLFFFFVSLSQSQMLKVFEQQKRVYALQ